MMNEKINIKKKFDLIDSYWSPKVLANLNGQQVKIAKFKGEFPRHKHENEDELFLVVKGKLKIKFDDGEVNLTEGEMMLVPKGVYHQPITESECHCMLFEPNTTLNTGNIKNEFTQKDLQGI